VDVAGIEPALLKLFIHSIVTFQPNHFTPIKAAVTDW